MIVTSLYQGFFIELLDPTVTDDRSTLGLPCGHALTSVERLFLLHLLSPQSFRELIKKSPGALLTTGFPGAQVPDVGTLLQALQEPMDQIPVRYQVGMSTILADPDTSVSR